MTLIHEADVRHMFFTLYINDGRHYFNVHDYIFEGAIKADALYAAYAAFVRKTL